MEGWVDKLLWELKNLPVNLVKFVNSLFSLKVLIITAQFLGCYYSNFKTVVVVITGITAFVFIFIRDIQRPDSQLSAIINNFVKFWGRNKDMI